MIEADYLGIVSGNKVPDKLERCGFHVTKSAHVNAPIIDEFPMALECTLVEITKYGIVGEIVNVSVDERVVAEDGGIDVKELAAIAFDPVNNAYLKVDEKVGNAFSDGKKLMELDLYGYKNGVYRSRLHFISNPYEGVRQS